MITLLSVLIIGVTIIIVVVLTVVLLALILLLILLSLVVDVILHGRIVALALDHGSGNVGDDDVFLTPFIIFILNIALNNSVLLNSAVLPPLILANDMDNDGTRVAVDALGLIFAVSVFEDVHGDGTRAVVYFLVPDAIVAIVIVVIVVIVVVIGVIVVILVVAIVLVFIVVHRNFMILLDKLFLRMPIVVLILVHVRIQELRRTVAFNLLQHAPFGQ
mmetsp:Transcript_16796/g.47670  ORF Transcript_16796/g.47670 Transcript_16796/m.47670 type:complete len:218 (+) Transcript_16796:775-1428(+)